MEDLANYLLIVAWIVFSILCGWYATNRLNRKWLPWALLAVFASPVVAAIALAVVGKKKDVPLNTLLDSFEGISRGRILKGKGVLK